MTKEYLEEYEKKLKYLSNLEKRHRDVYLRKIATGEIQGPQVGVRSIDKDWLKHYSEEEILKEYPRMTMYQYMMHKNRNHMSGTALRYFGRKISFTEFDRKIDNAVRSFKKLGVKKGDKVTLIMPNTPEGVISVYALNKMGAVAAMVHPKSAETEIKRFVNDIDSKFVVVIDAYANRVENIINDTNIEHVVVVKPEDSMSPLIKNYYIKNLKETNFKTNNKKFIEWEQFRDLTKDDNSFVETDGYRINKLAVLLRTGGSTGTPKACMLSDDNFNTMVEQFYKSEDDFKRGDKLLAMMPIFHGFGLCSSIHLPLSRGVSVNLIPDLKKQKKDLWKFMLFENHIIGVPSFLSAVLRDKKTLAIKKLFKTKYVVSGGDSDSDQTEVRFNDYLAKRKCKKKVRKGYGLAEMVAGATFASGDYNDIGSIGIPMIDTNVKLINPETGEEVNEDGIVGELVFQGPTVMMGYYNNEEETKDALRDGWLYTKDLACWNNGQLYFKGRRGDIIISSGNNVYPREIERTLVNHPAINQIVVVGVPDKVKYEVPKAIIVLNQGYTPSDDLINEFREICKKNLISYSNPYYYEFVKEIPETLLGKADRTSLKKNETKKLVLSNK
jgi:long-chain acyl-CoA synthetase